MRWLALALALLVLPAVAMGQSDTRKVAIFKQQGNIDGHGPDGVTGLTAGDARYANIALDVTETALQKMGVPYDVFLLPDSASWGGGGLADSTWFRQQGYFLTVFAVKRLHGSHNREAVKYFVDEAGGASTPAAPLSGRWGIPCLYFITDPLRAESVETGWWTRANKSGTDMARMAYANGDTLEFEMTRQAEILPSVADSTVVLIWSDTLANQSNWEEGVTGTFSVANKYKGNLYAFLIGQEDSRVKPTPVLIGLAETFRAASYVPPRKLGLMITLDHPIPDTGLFPTADSRTAAYDSLMAHADQEGWQFNAQTMSWSGDPEGQLDGGWATTIGQDIKSRGKRFHHVMHEHNVQMSLGGTDVEIYGGDSTIIRQRWNDLTNRLVDSLGVKLATGYEKLWGAPVGNTNRYYLPIVAQSGHYGFRASRADPDSVGHWSLVKYTIGTWEQPQAPILWADPTVYNGETMWAHAIYEWPPSTDTTWAGVAGSGIPNVPNDPEGYNAAVMRNAAYVAIWDGTLMWHLQANMLGPDPITVQMIRRLRYLTEHCSNILEVRPYISPDEPTRHAAASP